MSRAPCAFTAEQITTFASAAKQYAKEAIATSGDGMLCQAGNTFCDSRIDDAILQV